MQDKFCTRTLSAVIISALLGNYPQSKPVAFVRIRKTVLSLSKQIHKNTNYLKHLILTQIVEWKVLCEIGLEFS